MKNLLHCIFWLLHYSNWLLRLCMYIILNIGMEFLFSAQQVLTGISSNFVSTGSDTFSYKAVT